PFQSSSRHVLRVCPSHVCGRWCSNRGATAFTVARPQGGASLLMGDTAMPVSRRTFLMTAGASIAAPAVLRVTRANAAEVTLRLHHFLPPVASVPKHMLEPWAKRIETGTGGRLKIELYPSMQLGGTPPQLYDQAKDGVADIVWTLPGYTAGRFPSTEVFELPFVAARTAR